MKDNFEEVPELVLRNPGPAVYLYKADIYYKLGRTKNIRQRNKQIKLQLPFRAIPIHVIYTDDEVWLEDYWHRAFNAKRRNGEWFELNADEVQRFCSQDEISRPQNVQQNQFDFQATSSLQIDEPTCCDIVLVDQDSKSLFIAEVKQHFQKVAEQNPHFAKSIEKSRNYQLGIVESEIERLKSKLSYNELQAIQEWRRKAINSADAKVRTELKVD